VTVFFIIHGGGGGGGGGGGLSGVYLQLPTLPPACPASCCAAHQIKPSAAYPALSASLCRVVQSKNILAKDPLSALSRASRTCPTGCFFGFLALFLALLLAFLLALLFIIAYL